MQLNIFHKRKEKRQMHYKEEKQKQMKVKNRLKLVSKLSVITNLTKSIQIKIIIMLILISAIPVTVMGVSSYLKAKEILHSKLETTSKQTIEEISRGIDNYFFAQSHLVSIISADTNVINAKEKEEFDHVKEFFANVQQADDNIADVYFTLDSGIYYTYPEVMEINRDYKSRDWYKEAMNNPDKIVITKPYTNVGTGKRVVSIAQTIKAGNTIIGVAGMNIDLKIFSDSLSDVQVGSSGYIFTSDGDGNIITHPNPKMIGTDAATLQPNWEKINASKEGFTSYQDNGVSKFGAFYTSDLTGWKIISEMDRTELSSDTRTIINTFIVILIIVLLGSILVAIAFSKPIGKNIKILVGALEKLAKGDLSARVSIRSRDEFNLLGYHFNHMVNNISALIGEVKSSSDQLLDTSRILSGMAGETNISLNEVARAVEEIASGATMQAENSVDAVNRISELSDNLTLVNESTNRINNLSENTNQLTSEGLNKVQALIKTSNETEASTIRIAEIIKQMSKSTERISQISETIDGITSQTNLLSLNATIEAARAGAAGKGFAVVADEIRNLAEQSKKSTIQIKHIIEDITDKTKLTVEAMNKNGAQVKEQVIVVEETQFVFHNIMEAVNYLSKELTQIKDYTTDITTKKDNVLLQIENISAISEEAASATEEVTASTEQITVTMEEVTNHAYELQKLATALNSKVESFRF
jgi:methyl-accepting chemotaxis protein